MVDYRTQMEFESYIMGICEKIDIKSGKALIDLSNLLHEFVEEAIEEYILDDDELKIEDYNPNY